MSLDNKARMGAYREANRDRIREQKRAWNLRNPDKIKAMERRKYLKHGDAIRARVNRYRKENALLVKQRKAAYFQKHKERLTKKNHARYDANRDKILPVLRAYYLRNKESFAATARLKYIANPEYYKEKARNWKNINPERYRLTRARSSTMWRSRLFSASGRFTQEQVLARFNYFGWMCRYCREPLTAETVTLEHQIPLSRGGTNFPSNLVPACGSCNASKCDRLPREFRPDLFPLLHRPGNAAGNLFD